MNAIILAAGLGSRFKEITQQTHKALLPIQGIPNIERTIKYLQQANINNIYIVTGYLSEQFEYLAEKYNCNLLHNPKYKEYNSIYSFYQAIESFENSFVIDSDVVLFDNLFLNPPTQSCYFVLTRPKSSDKEWIPKLKQNGNIEQIIISNEQQPSLLGISYWQAEDCIKIKQELNNYLNIDILKNNALYWDNIPMNIIDKLNITIHEISLSQAYEMDNLSHYQFIQNHLNSN